MNEHRKLRVFLCHASQDKAIVRELYQRLLAEGWIDPWLDEEKLLPGQNWDIAIEKAVEAADAVIVCLSNNSVNKDGYVQKELMYVLDIADEKSEETIYIIPLRFDDCLRPRRLKKWQYVDFFPQPRKDWAYQRLIGSMQLCATKIDSNFLSKSSSNSIRNGTAANEKPQSKSSMPKATRNHEPASLESKEILLPKPILFDINVDAIRKVVMMTWKPVKESDKYSIEIINSNLSHEIISPVHGTSFEWCPKNWKGVYQIRLRVHKGTHLASESELQTVRLEPSKLPQPIIEIPKGLSSKVGTSLRFSCRSSGQPYSEKCEYQWRVGEAPAMKMPQLFPKLSQPHLDQKFDEPGTYHYQVRVQENGSWSDWSKIQKISLESQIEKPIISEPKSGSVVGLVFFLNCSEVRGAEKYVVFYQEYGTKEWKTYRGSGYSLTQKNGQCQFELKENNLGKYHFCIQATDKFGNNSISAAVTVEISNKI